MIEGFRRGWFDGYDWVIRVNADVLIRNDTWLLSTFRDSTVHGVFADCWDKVCPGERKCTERKMMADFFAFRPTAIPKDAFEKAYEIEDNAENHATLAFAPIVQRGNDSWLFGAGQHDMFCRVGGKTSPVIHEHDFDAVFPSCMLWYRDGGAKG